MLLRFAALALCAPLVAQEPLRVPGRVVLPEGAPREELTVVCRGHAFEDGRRESRCDVSADGTFEALFAPGTRRGRCTLESDHLIHAGESFWLQREQELVLRPELGVTLTIRFEAHEEVVGRELTVEVRPTGTARIRAARSVELGVETQVRFGGLEPSRFHLAWHGEGLAPGSRHLNLQDVGSAPTFTYAIGPGVTLEGHVVDARGAGVRATVEVVDPVGTRLARERTSLRSGAFRLEGLPPGDLRLKARRSGFEDGWLRLEGLEHGDERRGLVLRLAPLGGLNGVVLDMQGRPVLGATVHAFPEDVEWLDGWDHGPGLRDDVTGDQGGFDLRRLDQPTYRLLVEAEVAGRPAFAELRHERPTGEPLRLFLARGATLDLTVTDREDRPLSGGRVRLSRPGNDLPDLWSGAFVREGDVVGGAARIEDLAPGEWVAEVEVSRFQSVLLPLRVGAAAELTRAVRMAPLAELIGRAVGADGAPLAEAEVFLRSGHLELLEEPAALTRTDDEGRFAVRGVAPGSHQLAIRRGDGAPMGVASEVVVEPGTRRVEVEHVDPGAARVLLEVDPEALKERDRPSFSRRDRHFMLDYEHPDLDAGGRAELELTPGPWRVDIDVPYLQAPDARKVEAELDLAAGQVHHVRLGALAAPSARLSGRLTEAGTSVGERELRFSFDRGLRAEVRTNRVGGFSVVLPVGVPGYVRVGPWDDAIHLPLEIAADQTELSLELPAGRVAGRVLHEEGQPARGVRVALETWGESGEVRSRRADTGVDGEFEFRGVAAGDHRVKVGGGVPGRRPGGRPGGVIGVGADKVFLPRDREPGGRALELSVEEGAAREGLVLRLAGTGGLEGFVTDAAGRALPAVRIVLSDGLGGGSSAWTDRGGRYRVSGLVPGGMTLEVGHDGARTEREIVIAEGWTTLDLTID